MARIFWDGFDTYSSVTHWSERWIWATNSPAMNQTGRFGGKAIKYPGGTLNMFADMTGLLTDQISWGVALKPENLANFMDMKVLSAYNVGNEVNTQAKIRIDDVGRLIIYDGTNTAVYTGSINQVPSATWSYVGCSVLVHASAGKVSLTLNGNPLIEVTGLDTLGSSGTTGIAGLLLGGQNTFVVDDLFIDDTYAVSLPERRVEQLLVNADGAHLDFTQSTGATHFGVVDEGYISEVDYLSGTTVGHYDLLGVANLSNTPDAIDGVAIRTCAGKTDAATRAIKSMLDSSGSLSTAADKYLNATGRDLADFTLLDPATTAAWTASGVNGLQARVEITV